MSTRNHPGDAILADYASGALRPAFAVVTAAHLEHCAECRSRVADLEAAGGAMLEDLPKAAISESRLEQAMAALDVPVTEEDAPPRPTVDRIPFGGELWLAPGMSIRKAKVGHGDDLLYLLRLPAGQRTLPHGHRGVEFTTVLKGAYDDGNDHYGAGDFCEMDPSINHQPTVTRDGECICLIASELPMHMTTRVGRFVQSFLKV